MGINFFFRYYLHRVIYSFSCRVCRLEGMPNYDFADLCRLCTYTFCQRLGPKVYSVGMSSVVIFSLSTRKRRI